MKTTILSLISMLALQTFAYAQTTEDRTPLKSWVDESKKIVYFVPNPVLTVHAFELNSGDPEFWAQVSVSLSYSDTNPETTAGLQALQTQYPGYLLSRALISGSGSIHVSIPSLNINEDVPSRPAVEGPYINQTYYVSKSLDAALIREFNHPNFIQVAGKINYTEHVTKQMEYEAMESNGCPSLFQNGDTFFAVLEKYAQLSQRIEAMPLHYASTKEQLKVSVLLNCLSFSSPVGISSFQELLGLRLSLNPAPSKIFGQTLGQVDERVEEAFQPYLTKEMKK